MHDPIMTVIMVLSSIVGSVLLFWALSRSWSAYRSMVSRGADIPGQLGVKKRK